MSYKLENWKKQLVKAKEDLSKFNPTNLTQKQVNRETELLENKIADLLDKIEKEEGNVKPWEINEKGELIGNPAIEWLVKNPYKYVHKNNAYVLQLGDFEYDLFSAISMKEMHVEWNDKDFREIVSMEMEEQNYKYRKITYSFHEMGKDYLNLMTTDHWIQPTFFEKHHWIFDCLMYSLGGGKRENIEHLKKVITYKYLHPEEFKIPALVIFGEGSVGKNLLVDLVLAAIFGKHQTLSAKSESVLGKFNSSIKGKTVVLINEAVAIKTDMESVKDLIHKQRIIINEKNIAEYEVDNTPLYLLGGNSTDSAVMLGQDESDRRWSIMKVEKNFTMAWWISMYADGNGKDEWSIDDSTEWLTGGGDRKTLGSKDEISKWLGNLIQEYGGGKLPTALHGEDYKALMEDQKTIHVRFIEAVLGHGGFKCIERKVLYQGYVKELERVGNTRYKISDKKFYKMVREYMNKNKNIDEKEVRWSTRTRTLIPVFYRKDRNTACDMDTYEFYFNNRKEWEGPYI